MPPEPSLFLRYQDLQAYVGWSAADTERIRAAGALLLPHFADLLDDFYAEIQRHPATANVLTGGPQQIERLKAALRQWLGELFAGPYDEAYVARRWRVGQKHQEIGLPQVYTVAAMSRLRIGMIRHLRNLWAGEDGELALSLQAVGKLLDLDLAIIGDAYETEYVHREQAAERERLSDVLHREKELSSGLLAHAQAAVLVLEPGGRIVRANPFLQTLSAGCLGRPLERCNWLDDFLRPEDAQLVRDRLREQPAGGPRRPITVSSTLAAPAGSRQLHWSAAMLLDAVGQPFALLVIGHDVTDLYEAQQRALQAERLAAIGQIATGLAHESRNALQRIGASAEMLELELEGNQPALQQVARIEQAKNHLHQLLDEVRNYAARTLLDRSPLRVTEVWREAWELLLSQRKGRDAMLREQLVAADLTIEADRFRLVQVFRNLLDNALAATSDPVRIDVVCEPARLGEAPALAIRVRDNGPGLSGEQRRRIFEPFYTTKPTGTGLGTSIAQRLVEAHGGTIGVADIPPPGTEIVVTLPRRAGSAA